MLVQGRFWNLAIARVLAIVCAYFILLFSLGIMQHAFSHTVMDEAIKQIKYLAAFLFLSSSIHPSFFESLLAACYLLVAVCSYLLCEQLLSSLFLRLCPKP